MKIILDKDGLKLEPFTWKACLLFTVIIFGFVALMAIGTASIIERFL